MQTSDVHALPPAPSTLTLPLLGDMPAAPRLLSGDASALAVGLGVRLLRWLT